MHTGAPAEVGGDAKPQAQGDASDTGGTGGTATNAVTPSGSVATTTASASDLLKAVNSKKASSQGGGGGGGGEKGGGVGRRPNFALPFSSVEEVRRMTGAVDEKEVEAARSGPFTLYMNKIFAKTGITDGPYVLRRLHHWVRTEKNVQGQSAAAQRRYERLRKDKSALTLELEEKRNNFLLESHAMMVEGSPSGSRPASPGSPSVMSTGEVYDPLNAVTMAKVKLAAVERQSYDRTRRVLDASTTVNNLTDRLRKAAPSIAKQARSELAKAKAAKVAASSPVRERIGDGGGEAEEEGGGEGDEEEEESLATAEDLAADGTEEDAASLQYRAFVRAVPKKLALCEFILTKLAGETKNMSMPHDPTSPHRHTTVERTVAASGSSASAVAEREGARMAGSALRKFGGSPGSKPTSPSRGSPGGAPSMASPTGSSQPTSPAKGGGEEPLSEAAAPQAATAVTLTTTTTAESPKVPPTDPSASAPVLWRKPPSLGEDHGDEEEEEEATADEACIHNLKKRKNKGHVEVPPHEREDGRPLSPKEMRRIKRAASMQQLGTGGVLDRSERKIDSANFIKREQDRRAREEREAERARLEAKKPKPLYMQSLKR